MGEHKPNAPRRRTEPRLGDLDDLQDDASVPSVRTDAPTSRPTPEASRHHRTPPRRRRRTLFWSLLALLVVALGMLAWSQQNALRALLPRTHLNNLLVRANAALKAGNLDGNNGTSARELFGAVRALEPDNEQAIEGLQEVGKAELKRARQAIAERHFDAAQVALANARSLLGGGDAVNAVSSLLRKTQQSQAQTDALIAEAQQALAGGQLDGDKGAAALYRKALNADPDNAVARHGLDKVGEALANQARDALSNGQIGQADTLVSHIAALMPAYSGLPSLRAALSQAKQQQQAAVDDHLQKADDALRAGKVSGDGDDNALSQYQDVLKIDPNNAKAQAGLGQVAQALLLRASASIDAQDYGDAARLIDQAAKLAPHSADLAAMRSRLQSAQADAAQAEQSRLDPRQRARVDKLLARAKAAVQAGDFLLPPGASAYDLYSEVLNIDGNNQDALQGLQGLAGQARTRFDQALSSGDLVQANKMLSALSQLVPGDASQDDMRRRLASAWLDRAEQKIHDGDRAEAIRALDAAGKLRPDAPRLQSLRTRIGSKS